MAVSDIIALGQELDGLLGEQLKAARTEIESPYLALDSIVAAVQLEGEMRVVLSRHFTLGPAEIDRIIASLPESPESRRDVLLDLAAYCAVFLANDAQHAFPRRFAA